MLYILHTVVSITHSSIRSSISNHGTGGQYLYGSVPFDPYKIPEKQRRRLLRIYKMFCGKGLQRQVAMDLGVSQGAVSYAFHGVCRAERILSHIRKLLAAIPEEKLRISSPVLGRLIDEQKGGLECQQ